MVLKMVLKKYYTLENIYNVNTNVYIMICDGKVIGGYKVNVTEDNKFIYISQKVLNLVFEKN